MGKLLNLLFALSAFYSCTVTVSPDRDAGRDVEIACQEGLERIVKCGYNNRGQQKQVCVDGEYVNDGECKDNDKCALGTRLASFPSGACQERIDECRDTPEGARYHLIQDAVFPSEEVCDNKDNNCNGEIDENLTQLIWDECGINGRGILHQRCKKGIWKDDFCEDVDECLLGSRIASYSGPEGTEAVGICRPEIKECKDTLFGSKYEVIQQEVLPQKEICDGLDNDCDRKTDEDLTQACFSICGSGIEKCVNGSWKDCNAPQPETEVCDGLDNNCDGLIDKEFHHDEDMIADCFDNCPTVYNLDQSDSDDDKVGDACDNCLFDFNPDQTDFDEDGFGKVCDCNDNNPTISPRSEEICDGLDNNCNGQINEGIDCLIVFDDMEDGVVDRNKWTLVEDYNSEHGSSPSGFVEQNGAIGAHSSFSYSGDQAWIRFNTYNSNTGKPAFDFQQPKEINIDSYLSFKFKNSCFGEGYGQYYLIDEHGNRVRFYQFAATGNEDNIENVVLKLEKNNREFDLYKNNVFQSSVDTHPLNLNDKWAIEFYSYLASGGGCSNSAYMDIWVGEINYR